MRFPSPELDLLHRERSWDRVVKPADVYGLLFSLVYCTVIVCELTTQIHKLTRERFVIWMLTSAAPRLFHFMVVKQLFFLCWAGRMMELFCSANAECRPVLCSEQCREDIPVLFGLYRGAAWWLLQTLEQLCLVSCKPKLLQLPQPSSARRPLLHPRPLPLCLWVWLSCLHFSFTFLHSWKLRDN